MTPKHTDAMTSEEYAAHCDALTKRSVPPKPIPATPERYDALLAIAKELASKCLRGNGACIGCGAAAYMGSLQHNGNCPVVALKEFER